MKPKVLLIITTFNRKEMTLTFLRSLYQQDCLGKIELRALVVDDNSSDGTPEEIASHFPQVQVIKGSGDLYWAGAVKFALDGLGQELITYDYLVLANDDIELTQDAFSQLLETSGDKKALVGSTILTPEGRIEASGSKFGFICKPNLRTLKANGEIQSCDLLPGHLLLIPVSVFTELGGFESDLRYSYLDLTFSLTARRRGVPVLLAPKALATTLDYHSYFRDSIRRRGNLRDLIYLHFMHPKGPYWREAILYLRMVSKYFWWFWLPFYYRGFWISLILSFFRSVTPKD